MPHRDFLPDFVPKTGERPATLVFPGQMIRINNVSVPMSSDPFPYLYPKIYIPVPSSMSLSGDLELTFSNGAPNATPRTEK